MVSLSAERGGKCFCPFERIASLLVKIAYENSVSKVHIAWDGYKASDVSVTRKYQDQNLGFSAEDRLNAMQSDTIEGVVWFDDKKYTFTCRNDLVAEAILAPSVQFEGKTLSNGRLVTGEKACYPEAFRTTALRMSMLDEIPVDMPVSSARVFYQYILDSVDTAIKHVEIRGPSNMFFNMYPDFAVNTESGRAVILTTRKPATVSQKRQQSSRLDNKTYPHVSVILDYDHDKHLPFVIRQDMYTIRGTPLSCEAILQILKIVAYIELSEKYQYATPGVFSALGFLDGEVHVPLLEVAGHFVVDPAYWTQIMGYVCDCAPVRKIFDRYVASPDELMIKFTEKQQIALLTSNVRPSSACFAYAFTSALIIDKDLPTSVFFELLNALILDGRYMTILNTGVLEGSTNKGKLAAGTEQFVLPVVGVKLDQIKREQLIAKKDLTEGVLYLVGGDFEGPTVNRNPGGCDHYLLAYYRDGGFDIAYDPLASAGRPYGSRISSVSDIGQLNVGRVSAEVRYV